MSNAIERPELQVLIGEINTEHTAVEASLRAGLAHALRAGELLIAGKKLVAHGAWLQWLADNCQFSLRTAQAYMRLATRKPELEAKCATRCGFEDLSLREGLKLLADHGEQDSDEKESKQESRFVPPSGCLLFGHDRKIQMIVAHSAPHPGYCFVVRLDNVYDDNLDIVVESSERAIRNDAVETALRRLAVDYRSLEWEKIPAAPWPDNKDYLGCINYGWWS